MTQQIVGGEAKYSSKQLNDAMQKLFDLAQEAAEKDAQELQNAMDAVQTHCFRQGHNAQSTIDACNDLVERLNEMLTNMSNSLQPIAQMCDYAERIETEVTPGWDDVLTKLEAVRNEMPELGIDSWGGTGSNKYHETLKSRIRDTDVHIGLSENARGSIDAVSLVQRGITTQAYNALQEAANSAENTVRTPPETFSKGAWFNPNANKHEYSFDFYRRTVAMLNACAPAESVLSELGGGNPWRPTSTGIADQLGTALTEARSNQEIKNDNYDSTVDEVGEEYKSDLDVDTEKIHR